METAMLKSGKTFLKSKERFSRGLHASHFRFASLKHFIAQRLRPAGFTLAAVLLLAACLSLGHPFAATYLLFSFTLGLFLIAVPSAIVRRAKLEAKRELPRYATVGQSLRYTIHVRHLGRGRLKRAWLRDVAPDPRPSFEDFHHLREPGENTRNLFDRKFAYFRWQWLLIQNRLFVDGNSADMLDIAHSGHTQVTLSLTPLRRGVIQLNDLRVLLPDLFGFFQRCHRVTAPAATLLVLPRRYPLPPIELPGGAAFKNTGEASTNAIGSSGEFVGLRDYRPGDPLRQIHWKSWARTGRPIVKELENTFYPRYGLVVDTLCLSHADAQFEEVISVAASFAAGIDTSDTLLDLMFIKSQTHRVSAGRGHERAERLLEVLAAVTPEREADYDALARLVLLHRDDLTSCLIIFNGWDEQRAGFLKKLTHQGILCAPIIIGLGTAPEGLPGHWLASGNIAQDLQRLRGKLHARS